MTTPGNSYSSPVNLSLPAVPNYDGTDESAGLQFQYISNALATLNQALAALTNAIVPTVYTVATLPLVANVPVGTESFVTDATVTTFASIVVGGGANKVPVHSDGTNWRIG